MSKAHHFAKAKVRRDSDLSTFNTATTNAITTRPVDLVRDASDEEYGFTWARWGQGPLQIHCKQISGVGRKPAWLEQLPVSTLLLGLGAPRPNQDVNI